MRIATGLGAGKRRYLTLGQAIACVQPRVSSPKWTSDRDGDVNQNGSNGGGGGFGFQKGLKHFFRMACRLSACRLLIWTTTWVVGTSLLLQEYLIRQEIYPCKDYLCCQCEQLEWEANVEIMVHPSLEFACGVWFGGILQRTRMRKKYRQKVYLHYGFLDFNSNKWSIELLRSTLIRTADHIQSGPIWARLASCPQLADFFWFRHVIQTQKH